MSEELMQPKLLLTTSEAAQRLSIGRSLLYLHIQENSLRTVRLGRNRRIAVKDLEEFVERLRAQAIEELELASRRSRPVAVKSVAPIRGRR
jgi:excisionase family DNA binding protein